MPNQLGVDVDPFVFKMGARVRKNHGYKFPGIIVARYFSHHKNKEMYVVECTADDCAGIQHIFSVLDIDIIPTEGAPIVRDSSSVQS